MKLETTLSAESSLAFLLTEDLKEASYARLAEAKAELEARPSSLRLLNHLRQWAAALAKTARPFAPRFVKAASSKLSMADRAQRAFKEITDEVLCHLGIPSFVGSPDDWAETNFVRAFILNAVGAPLDLESGELAIKPLLPLWLGSKCDGGTSLGSSLGSTKRLLQSVQRAPKRADSYLDPSESEQLLRELKREFRGQVVCALTVVLAEVRSEVGGGERLVDGVSSGRSESERRADCVARVLGELQILGDEAHFELPEDYSPMREQYSEFYIFTNGIRFPTIKEKILQVKNMPGRKLKPLALEIVRICEGVTIHTIQQDWKKHKPFKFKHSVKHPVT